MKLDVAKAKGIKEKLQFQLANQEKMRKTERNGSGKLTKGGAVQESSGATCKGPGGKNKKDDHLKFWRDSCGVSLFFAD